MKKYKSFIVWTGDRFRTFASFVEAVQFVRQNPESDYPQETNHFPSGQSGDLADWERMVRTVFAERS